MHMLSASRPCPQIMWGVPQDAVWRVDFERLDKEPPLALLNHVEDLNAQDQALAVALFQGDPDFQTKSDG